MGVRKRGNVYRIDYYVNGRRVFESVGPSKKLAQDVLAKRRLQVLENKYQLPSRARVTFDEAVEQYMEWARQHKQSWRRDSELLKRMSREFGGRTLADISTFLIQRMKANLLGQGLSKSTVNRYLACLSGLFHRMQEWDIFSGVNPVKKVTRFRESPGRIRYLQTEEFSRLHKVCNSELWQAVTIAIHSGMRAGELFNLKWSDIDLENKIIRVVVSKNNTRRDIPMSAGAYAVFVARQHTGEYVFSQPDGRPHHQHMRAVWVRACRKAGLTGLRWHDLRHTFASHLVMNGASIFAVQELLGHKSLAMTRRYSHLSPGVLREAVCAMDKVMGNGAKLEPKVDSEGSATDLRKVSFSSA